MQLNKIPLLRLLLPFVAGIITAAFYQFNHPFIGALLSVFFLATVVLTFIKLKLPHFLYGAVLHITLFFFGYVLLINDTDNFKPNHFKNYVDNSNWALIKVNSRMIEKQKSLNFKCEVLQVRTNNGWEKVDGKLMTYFQKDSISKEIKYGDILFVQANFSEIKPPQNPGEFNYKRFLGFHNIYNQAYIKADKIIFTNINQGNKIIAICENLRNTFLKTFQEFGLKGEEFAVAAALVLGYVDDLDAGLLSAYSSAGALHVLSVSGLHVGIIFFVFSLAFTFLEKIKYGTAIKAILLVCVLWFYAALTGLSPSVLRAATMFSFIVIGKSFMRYTNIYNTLAASAIFLLIINPYIVMEVGFQLSYLAVLGIVALQSHLYNLWETDNWLLDKIWMISSVSIAAQIATFPLGLLYFHQFPNYFLLSNLIVIPISTVILYLGLGLIIFSFIQVVGLFIGKLLIFSIYGLNYSVKLTELLPYSVTSAILISVAESWFIYGVIVFSLLFFLFKRTVYVYPTLVFLSAILFVRIYNSYHLQQQKLLVVYNTPGTRAVNFISGDKNYFLADSALCKNNSKMLFHIKHHWWEKGFSDAEIINGNDRFNFESLIKNNNLYSFAGKNIALFDSTLNQNKNKFKTDILILTDTRKFKIEEVIERFEPGLIIFDSTISGKWLDKLKLKCEGLCVKYYAVSESGAFVKDLNSKG